MRLPEPACSPCDGMVASATFASDTSSHSQLAPTAKPRKAKPSPPRLVTLGLSGGAVGDGVGAGVASMSAGIDRAFRVIARAQSVAFETERDEGNSVEDPSPFERLPVPRDALWEEFHVLIPGLGRGEFNGAWSKVAREVWRKRSGWSREHNFALSGTGRFAWNVRLMRSLPLVPRDNPVPGEGEEKQEEPLDVDDSRLTATQMKERLEKYRSLVHRMYATMTKPLRDLLFTSEGHEFMENPLKGEEAFPEHLISEDVMWSRATVTTAPGASGRETGSITLHGPLDSGDLYPDVSGMAAAWNTLGRPRSSSARGTVTHVWARESQAMSLYRSIGERPSERTSVRQRARMFVRINEET